MADPLGPVWQPLGHPFRIAIAHLIKLVGEPAQPYVTAAEGGLPGGADG
jgi:hypothetical protein